MAYPKQPSDFIRSASIIGPSIASSIRAIITTIIESLDHSTIISIKILKINILNKYNEEYKKLDKFLLQCDLYLSFNSNQINEDIDKGLYIIIYLRGKAQ